MSRGALRSMELLSKRVKADAPTICEIESERERSLDSRMAELHLAVYPAPLKLSRYQKRSRSQK
jgi:hypothetical protein